MSDLVGADKLRARLKAIGDTRAFLKGLQVGTVEEAKRLVPRRSGHLARSTRPAALSERDAFVVAATPYAAFVEYGTGLYGPRRKRIYPKGNKPMSWPTGSFARKSGQASVRAFTSDGSRRRNTAKGGWAYARSIAGSRAQPFLLPGAKKAANDRGADVVVSLWNDAA